MKDFLHKLLYNNKTGEPSLTAVLMIGSFIACIIAGALEMKEVVKGTSLFLELFVVCGSMYCGRRIQFGSKVYGDNKDESK